MVLGKSVNRPARLDQGLADELLKIQNDASFETVLGTTMCTDDFYEGQINSPQIGRLTISIIVDWKIYYAL